MAERAVKTLLILDGQGGGVGRRIGERLLGEKLPVELIAVGSNAIATSNMMKAGIAAGATGESAWCYNCARADIIAGPIGILLANAMYGEISPRMALAVSGSLAVKLLVPMANHHHNVHIVGLADRGVNACLDEMAARLAEML